MKSRYPSRLLCSVWLWAAPLVGLAAEAPPLIGEWQLDVAKSSEISPWDYETLAITLNGDVVQIDREMRWGKDRKVSDSTRANPDGTTVTTVPVTYWLDSWYNNVYIGTDHQKHVKGSWTDGGRGLTLVTNLNLEAQQGDVPVQVDDHYVVSEDGRTLTLTQTRSTRDQVMTYVFDRVLKFAEPAGTVTTASGLKYAITHHGDGPQAAAGEVVIAHYTGSLVDGTVFDSSVPRGTPFVFTLGKKQVIKGWDEAFALLHVGDKATLIIPPALAYGDRERPTIPAGSTLKFDVEFLGVAKQALADYIQEQIAADGLQAALQRYLALKADNFPDLYVSESQLNSLGYTYLAKDQLPEALAIFKLNVELFPMSGNTHDSLGEALLKNGERDLALAEYQQSLALDPSNENAAKVIADLTKSE